MKCSRCTDARMTPLVAAMQLWRVVPDGHPIAAAMYDRHYSSERSRKRRQERGTRQFCGPSERLVLLSPCRRALLAWRRHGIRDDEQVGVECSIFRNEGVAGLRSSALVRAADIIADAKWPGQRHFTFVDEAATASGRGEWAKAGQCFRKAGWRPCGRSQERGLLILERTPAQIAQRDASRRMNPGDSPNG